tara:strand:- start:1130 stop:1711 length:582 start_codon:yes stop_codon:yes gene_type:complete
MKITRSQLRRLLLEMSRTERGLDYAKSIGVRKSKYPSEKVEALFMMPAGSISRKYIFPEHLSDEFNYVHQMGKDNSVKIVEEDFESVISLNGLESELGHYRNDPSGRKMFHVLGGMTSRFSIPDTMFFIDTYGTASPIREKAANFSDQFVNVMPTIDGLGFIPSPTTQREIEKAIKRKPFIVDIYGKEGEYNI